MNLKNYILSFNFLVMKFNEIEKSIMFCLPIHQYMTGAADRIMVMEQGVGVMMHWITWDILTLNSG